MRNRAIQLLIPFLVVAAFMVGLIGGTASPASASGLTPPIWVVTPNPNPPNPVQSSLTGISCVGQSFCMAVGTSSANTGQSTGVQTTLVEEWNGTSWSIVPSPNPPGSNALLTGVSCPSTTDCVVVGWSTASQSSPDVPLAEIWNGSNWSIVNVPAGSWSGQTILLGVSCSEPTDCWAAGAQGPITLLEHWDGSSWAGLSVPQPPGTLSSISCSSATDCIAVGAGGSVNGRPTNPLSVQWNGRSWSVLSTPTVLTYTTHLSGISCSSSTSCTAEIGRAHV